MDTPNRKQRRAAKANARRNGLPIVGQAASGRECGECHECCAHIKVEEEPIAHEAHVDCPKLERGVDERRVCGIYDERPATCRNFECLWLQGFEGNDYKPTRCGFIMRVSTTGHVIFTPIREGVFDDVDGFGMRAALRAVHGGAPVGVVVEGWKDGTSRLLTRVKNAGEDKPAEPS
jgi:hypothetical protein